MTLCVTDVPSALNLRLSFSVISVPYEDYSACPFTSLFLEVLDLAKMNLTYFIALFIPLFPYFLFISVFLVCFPQEHLSNLLCFK